MRIFLSHGYNPRDQWIPALFSPLIRAFGSEVLTGQAAFGVAISDHVREQIERSDALLAFLTRRDDEGGGKWSTHRWVIEEIAVAVARRIPFVEIRENGVDPQPGIAGPFQRIALDENRAECVGEVATAIATLHRRARLKMQLLPEEFIRSVQPHVGRPGSRCTYTYIDGAQESQPFETRVIPVKGGLFCYTPNVPEDALVRIRFEAAGRAWVSDYESPDALNVYLRAEN